MLAEVRRRFILAVVVVAIVMVAVSSIGHIKASTRMVLRQSAGSRRRLDGVPQIRRLL
jgi:hypothetical protein